MSPKTIEEFTSKEYQYGFKTQIETDTIPKGLTEETVRLISSRKREPEFMLEFRLKAFRHWQKMKEPHWANVHHAPIDYQDISYYSAPKPSKEKLKSLEEVDPELRKTFEKLGISLLEQNAGRRFFALLSWMFPSNSNCKKPTTRIMFLKNS